MGVLDAPAPSIARVAKAESLLRIGGGGTATTKMTAVIFGDSIVNQGSSQYNTSGPVIRTYNASGWWNHMQAQLGHRFKLLRNSGVPGESTAQWLTRVQSDVVSKAPGWCFIGGPTNDATQVSAGTITIASVQANLTAIWNALDAAGIRIVQGTITPRNNSTTVVRAAIFPINQWLREQARTRPGLVLVDWYAALSSGTSADWISGHSSPADTSGLHPQTQGAFAMGRLMAERVAPMTPAVEILPPSAAEPANLVGTAALGLGTGGTAGTGGSGTVATGWRVDPLPTATFACSKVARTDGIPGEWQQVKVTSGQVKIGVNVTGFGSVYNTGDEVYAIAEFETDEDLTPGVGSFVRLNLIAMKADFGVGTQAIDFEVPSDGNFPPAAYFPRRGVMMTPLTVVPSTATLRLALQFERKGAGTVRVGRIGIYKKDTGPGADVWDGVIPAS